MTTEILKPGDTIDVVAPGSGFICKKQLTFAKSYIESQGYAVNIPDDLFNETLFCANTDEYRFKNLKDSIYNNSKAIWCYKGGYGSARIISYLNNLPYPSKQKIFIGFSDITALNLYLHQIWHWQPIHGMTFRQIACTSQNPQNLSQLLGLITGKIPGVIIDNIIPLNSIAHQLTEISGAITGGNLSLIQTSISTLWHIDTVNKILFLEDIDEKDYKIDRMLEHLLQANLFSKIKALIFGDFIDLANHSSKFSVDLALNRIASVIQAPVFKTNQIGHGDNNTPIPYGSNATITSTNKNGTIEFRLDIRSPFIGK